MLIDPQLQRAVQTSLETGEELLWAGKPNARRMALQTASAFGLGIVWICFTAHFIRQWLHTSSGMPAGLHYSWDLPMLIFMIPFIGLGLRMLLTPLWTYIRANKTIYALTDRRVIVIEQMPRRTIRSYYAQDIGIIARVNIGGGAGDLLYAQRKDKEAMRESKSGSLYSGQIGCGVFTILFGLFFVVSGVLWVWPMLSFGLRHGDYTFMFGFTIYIAFGVMMVWGGISQINQSLKFDEPKIEFSPAAIRPGEKVTFIYQRNARRSLEIRSIGVFLVYHENVSYYDGSETKTKGVDRLVQQSIHAGKHYEAGELLREEHTFQIPTGEMGIRNPYMGRKNAKAEAAWAIKVRINLGKASDIWDAYELKVTEQPLSTKTPSTYSAQDRRFDVLLVEVGPMAANRIMNVMSDLLPHLHSGQVGDLYFSRPSLLRENLTSAEAQSMKEKLEAVGAIVHIEPAGAG